MKTAQVKRAHDPWAEKTGTVKWEDWRIFLFEINW